MTFTRILLLLCLLTLGAEILSVRRDAPPIQTAATDFRPPVDDRFDRTISDVNLQKRADALLPLFDRMPPVTIRLKDAPITKSGTNVETGNAYTLCDQNSPPLIFVKRIYYQTAHPLKFENTLKHELTHAWLCRQNLMSVGHGDIFRRQLRQVGGWLNQSEKSQ